MSQASDSRTRRSQHRQDAPDILLTRIEPPALRKGLVDRQHLVTRLENAIDRQHRLIVVSAPAGFGKSTLILQWLDSTRHDPVIWLTLDSSCNDPLRFLHYLKAAIGRSIPKFSGSQTMSGFLQPLVLTRELTHLVNRLAEVRHPIVLVLDDYQIITEPAIEAGMSFLIDNAPPCLHIVIISRVQPAFSLARLRAEDACTELHTDDLRFNILETTDYFAQTDHLSSTQVAALHGRTEGWVAGLQLARTALSSYQDIDTFINNFTGSHRFVMDYLTSEVLAHQPARLRSFLLQTSILSEMNAGLCAAVTGYPDSARLLEQIEQANLFLISLDSRLYWCRYHYLFVELLRHHLVQEHPEHIQSLHKRAGEWYLAEGYLVEGVHHLLGAGEHEKATEVLLTHFMEVLLPGEEHALRRCLLAFPADYTLQNDGLCLLWACVHTLELQPYLTEQWLNRVDASRLSGPLHNLACLLRGIVASAHGYHGDAEAHVLHALRLAETHNSEHGVQRDTNHVISLVALSMLVSLLSRQSRVQEAEQFLQHYFATLTPSPHRYRRLNLYLLASIYWKWGVIQYDQNHVDRAATLFQKAMDISREGEIPRYQSLGHMSMAWVAHTLGEPEQVRFHLEKSSFYVMQDYGTDLHRDHVIAAAHLLLLRHQTPADLQDEVFHQLDLVASGVHESAHYQARVVAKLVMGLRAYYHDLDEAERWLQLAYGQLDSATATGYDTSRIKALILDAVLHEKRGEGQKALPLLCEALEAAARTRFIRPILNMGTPVIDLLRKYRPRLSASLDDEFVRSLFLAIRQTLPDDQPTLIEPLTNREQEILELIADNQSNQAIAETLVISVATVKWHISNIYSKLGVSNRLEAVNRARQLRLFPIITPTWGWVLPEPCEVSYVCSVLLGFVQPL